MGTRAPEGYRESECPLFYLLHLYIHIYPHLNQQPAKTDYHRAQLLTSQYGVSPRLQSMMGSEPGKSQTIESFSPKLVSARQSRFAKSNPELEKPQVVSIGDLEDGYGRQFYHANGDPLARSSGVVPDSTNFSGFSFSHIVDQIWHFSSVDYGPRCKKNVSLRSLKGFVWAERQTELTVYRSVRGV